MSEAIFTSPSTETEAIAALDGSLSLPLPKRVPLILRVPEAVPRFAAAALGIAVGVAMAFRVEQRMPAGNPVREMFNLRQPSSAIPVAILCLFCWGILSGVARLARLAALSTLNNRRLLKSITEILKNQGLAEVLAALDTDVASRSPVLRRVRAAVEQWELKPSLQNASIALEQQIVLDREATHRGYNLLRLFVWAAPVLGLIGTVIGISLAVGGFAHFLSTDVEDISKIKAGLVGVTGGLSFAFLITLEGLLSSLLLMLFASSLQTWEERLLAGVEQSVADFFLPELQRIVPEWTPAASQAELSTDALDRMARKIGEEMFAAVGEIAKTVVSRIEGSHRAQFVELSSIRGSFDQAAQNVRASMEWAAQSVAATLERSGAVMGNQSLQIVAAQNATLERLLATARQSVELCAGEMARVSRAVTSSATESTEAVGAQMKAVVQSITDAADSHRAAMQQATAESRQALASHVAGISHASGAVEQLGAVTRQVLESQAKLQSALGQVGDYGLAGALSDLASSLVSLRPVLTNLAQPFVLQAVPVSARPTNHALER